MITPIIPIIPINHCFPRPTGALGIGDLDLRAAGDGETSILTSQREGRGFSWDFPMVYLGKPMIYLEKPMVTLERPMGFTWENPMVYPGKMIFSG